MKEIWKNINGFEGFYQVSNCGNIRSLDRYVNCNRNSKQLKRGIKINPFINHKGYGMVDLRINKNRKTISVHRLVALHFIDNPLNKPQVNHIDGNKLNNNASNLEWATNSENQIHAYANNLNCAKRGEDNSYAKLTEKEVIQIKRLRGIMRNKDIATKFNIGRNNISMILTGKTWRHIIV